MSYMFGTYSYDKPERNAEIMQDKIRVLELQKLVDSERLATYNLKLEAKLLKMKILNIKTGKTKGGESRGNSLLPNLTPMNKTFRNMPISLTPHPTRIKNKFLY